jgi:hypothetical protein
MIGGRQHRRTDAEEARLPAKQEEEEEKRISYFIFVPSFNPLKPVLPWLDGNLPLQATSIFPSESHPKPVHYC